jgi:hypothetical protein
MLNRLGMTLAALVLAAGVAAAQTGTQSDADAKEIAAYRLTNDGLNKVRTANRAMIVEVRKDPKFQELARIEAEAKALEEKDERTEADDKRLEELNAKQEQLSEAYSGVSLNDAKTLTDMEKRIAQFAPMANGLRAAGMPPREYAKFTLALLQAGMAAGLKKAGMVTEIPKEIPADNVKFVEEHAAELEAMQKEWEALSARKGGA